MNRLAVDIGLRLGVYTLSIPLRYKGEKMKPTTTIILLCSAAATMLWGSSGADIAEKNGCMACHHLVGKGTGPAFRGIANRNLMRNRAGAKDTIVQSIQKGSKGKYPAYTAEMPPFAHLSASELNTLADWILSQATAKGRGHGRGHGHGRGRGMMH